MEDCVPYDHPIAYIYIYKTEYLPLWFWQKYRISLAIPMLSLPSFSDLLFFSFFLFYINYDLLVTIQLILPPPSTHHHLLFNTLCRFALVAKHVIKAMLAPDGGNPPTASSTPVSKTKKVVVLSSVQATRSVTPLRIPYRTLLVDPPI